MSSMEALLDGLVKRTSAIDVTGANAAEKAYVVSNICRRLKVPVVYVTAGQKDAERFMEDFTFFAGNTGLPAIHFPPYNILPFKSLSYHNETAARRIDSLYRMVEGGAPEVTVTTVDTLLQRLIPRREIADFAELVMAGEEVDRDKLVAKLVAGGYVRATIVEEPGDLCIRGGILDVFSPNYPDPVRIELFGDLVESIRFFSAVDQRKTGEAFEVTLLPAREAVLEKASLADVINRVRAQAADLALPVTTSRKIIEAIREEGAFPGIEGLLPLVYPELSTFFDYVPEKAVFVLDEPAQLAAAAENAARKAQENFEAAKEDRRLCVEPERFTLGWEEALGLLEKRRPVSLRGLALAAPGAQEAAAAFRHDFTVSDNRGLSAELLAARGRENLLKPLQEWIAKRKEEGLAVFLVASTRSQAERLRSLMGPYGMDLSILPDFPAPDAGQIAKNRGVAWICEGRVSAGFVWPAESLAVLTEDEIFGEKQRVRRRADRRVRTELLSLETMSEGDIVVHTEHGLGRYEGMEKLTLDRITSDFVLISYRDGDRLYLPVDRMSMVQKYAGVDGISPILDKMGGVSFQKLKEKAKKSVEKIAGELLKLYAERKVKKGYAFSPVDSYFSDFEAAFPYEETPGQVKAIDDVLADMEAETPMDRLVCGDVGYGKTEVALRAAFKAVGDGKQVAVLVPTTVLAEQHLKNFKERFANYPVNVAGLSRFRTAKAQREIIAGMEKGTVDIVIGTHRLLSKDAVFKDLGLMVVDEEQRFGVRHKERMKKFKAQVDVLTLSATPIPRTLHMSMMGMRDISLITTPPEQRQPIVSYISEYDDAVIAEAIQREMERKGQVFFVHNNINTIQKQADALRKLVPAAKVGVAHGRMTESELEKEMFRFIDRSIDVLVCTTIIESGLDIPSANTMLINRADRLGLSQIYQLRGRVGRGGDQAYAYLFVPEEAKLGKDAAKRLRVLMEHTDLGSGFQIAMSDLQIRGGGAMLGASQSGHIAAVGYDMFLKLLENAMDDMKGVQTVEKLEPEINIDISTFFPEDYVPAIDQRLLLYRRLARMESLKEIAELKGELTDRYGKLPETAANILLKIMLKILSIEAGVKKLDLHGTNLAMAFSEAHQKKPFGIVALVAKGESQFRFTKDHVLRASLKKGGINSLLVQAKNILKEVARHVNG